MYRHRQRELSQGCLAHTPLITPLSRRNPLTRQNDRQVANRVVRSEPNNRTVILTTVKLSA